MNKEVMDREEMLDRYMLDSMDDAERQEFEYMMDDDDELREDMEFLKDLTEALSRRDQNIRSMKRWQQEQSGLQKNRRVVLWRRLTYAAAACALLFMCLSYPYSYYGLQDRGFLDSQARGGYDKVTEYIESARYEDALGLLNDSIMELESSLSSSVHKDYVSSEINYLEWTRIQVLLKMKEFESAYDAVSEFRSDAGIYHKKADKLYNRLKLRLRK